MVEVTLQSRGREGVQGLGNSSQGWGEERFEPSPILENSMKYDIFIPEQILVENNGIFVL